MSPLLHSSPATRRALAALLVSVAAGGCYDGEELARRVRQKAIRTRVEEIDLGAYRVTLPRDPYSGEMTEVEVGLFGESSRYRLNEIEKTLKTHDAAVRDQTLRVLRQATPEELADPDLGGLRKRLLASMNEVLDDEPLDRLGFRHVRFLRH